MTVSGWPANGDRVAVLSTDVGRPTGVRLATVARTTDTQIILDDDTRWRRKDLRAHGRQRDTWSTTDAVLRPVNDPEVIAYRAGASLRNLGHQVQPWLAGSRTRVDDPDAALELLALVEQATAVTRQRLEALKQQFPKEGS